MALTLAITVSQRKTLGIQSLVPGSYWLKNWQLQLSRGTPSLQGSGFWPLLAKTLAITVAQRNTPGLQGMVHGSYWLKHWQSQLAKETQQVARV